MICISDNDIILKLSACDLLEEAVVVLESTKQEVYVLPSARYKIGGDRKGKLQSKYGADGIAKALEFIDSVQELTQPPLPEEQSLLVQVEGIDDGEAILFGATAFFDSFILATGDKRSLRALHSEPDCAGIYGRLAGRIICLEQIIVRLVPQLGFPEVRSRIVPTSACDTVLRAAFGSGLRLKKASSWSISRHISPDCAPRQELCFVRIELPPLKKRFWDGVFR